MSSFLDGFTVDPALDATPAAAPRSKMRAARPRTEHSIRADVLARLITDLGGYGIVKHQTGLGTRGTPDLFACVDGRMIVIETKTGANVPTPAQRGELKKWQNAGALTGWVRCVTDLDQILSHLSDPEWRNTFDHPGDGRGENEPW